mmetsp:Transcript_71175/g.169927  ORF Transcript_71175/g.169927 Transcript_71175/m.169927 type:complete len:218 (+) Transcript_71175:186-839(+)
MSRLRFESELCNELGDEDHHLHFRKPCTKAHASSEGEGLLDQLVVKQGLQRVVLACLHGLGHKAFRPEGPGIVDNLRISLKNGAAHVNPGACGNAVTAKIQVAVYIAEGDTFENRSESMRLSHDGFEIGHRRQLLPGEVAAWTQDLVNLFAELLLCLWILRQVDHSPHQHVVSGVQASNDHAASFAADTFDIEDATLVQANDPRHLLLWALEVLVSL